MALLLCTGSASRLFKSLWRKYTYDVVYFSIMSNEEIDFRRVIVRGMQKFSMIVNLVISLFLTQKTISRYKWAKSVVP